MEIIPNPNKMLANKKRAPVRALLINLVSLLTSHTASQLSLCHRQT